MIYVFSVDAKVSIAVKTMVILERFCEQVETLFWWVSSSSSLSTHYTPVSEAKAATQSLERRYGTDIRANLTLRKSAGSSHPKLVRPSQESDHNFAIQLSDLTRV